MTATFHIRQFGASENSKCHGLKVYSESQDIPVYENEEQLRGRNDLLPKRTSTANAIWKGVSFGVRQSWWTFPMLIILFPILSAFNGTYAKMPSWWSFVHIDHLRNNKIGQLICTAFLLSNAFYFVSGLYLLNKVKLRNLSFNAKTSIGSSKDASAYKARYPMLGWLVLCSGMISLLYHTFQALGPLPVAESLCFIDHGLAISSFFLFF